LQENGFEIGGSETMVVSGPVPINDCCGRSKLIEIEDPRLAQAEMFAQWLDLYLDKGVKTIGFGNIDDFYAWTQDSGPPDANPTLFDIDFRAKPAYYAIVQVLYEHIP
ncbi:MAG TPA: endo-1,4-beta-xylanase, partial [Anaerolineales bacterium]|nr:endo-1,4-beta-xylanase [Anaerolineales bacterium]